jgi:hypothetical protein
MLVNKKPTDLKQFSSSNPPLIEYGSFKFPI